jgi:transposase InsO family protein
MQSLKKYNKGYRFLLMCIDVLSKFAWVIPLKDKTGPSLVTAVKEILKSNRKPQKVHTDRGTEFTNKLLQTFFKEHGIKHYHTYNLTKASLIERFIRTFKGKLTKYMSYENTLTYIDVLQDVVNSYNHSFHRSIQMEPALVSKLNERQVWYTLYSSEPRRKGYKFKVGDQVRISISKNI